MLQPHSFLWTYLWVAPSVLVLILAFLLGQRRLHRRYPLFFAFVIVSAIEDLTLYACDVIPSVTPETWWRVFWVGLLVEGLVKFALIGEIFGDVFGAYASVAKLGKLLIRGVGVVLIFAAVAAAAYALADSRFAIVSRAHVLEEAIYLIESGLLLFIFMFAAYFGIRMSRRTFGISLGLAISGCVHLATWAIAANGVLPPTERSVLDFVNMATYHVCVLIWYYFLLVPKRETRPPESPVAGPPIEEHLEEWNRELERLLQ
jgi:hypothetical protein